MTFDQDKVTTTTTPKTIVTSYRPGTADTKTTMCSGYYSAGKGFVIVGLDSQTCITEVQEIMLFRKHFMALRNHPYFENSRYLLVPENNFGNMHTVVAMVADIPGSEVYYEKGAKRPGLYNSYNQNQTYKTLLASSLAASMIRFDKELFTVSEASTPEYVVHLLREQILQCSPSLPMTLAQAMFIAQISE
jgi:hypothetical protein